jgi:hypothetical protein
MNEPMAFNRAVSVVKMTARMNHKQESDQKKNKQRKKIYFTQD